MVSSQVGFDVVRRFGTWLVAFAVLTWFAPAYGQTKLSSEQTLEAEQLGEQGVNAFNSGRFDEAVEPLEAGYTLSGWGTIGVWLAKTYEKRNQPLEAHRVYSEVAASTPIPGEAAPFAEARSEAATALTRLESSLAVIALESAEPLDTLQVRINGEVRRVSKVNTVAVAPGESTVEALLNDKPVASKALTLQAGQREVIEVTSAATGQIPPAAAPATKGAAEPVTQSLDFSMVELTGWTLHDEKGNQICALPCKWSGTDPESLTVRRGEQKLPVRMGRRYARDPNLLVTVNPERGSKGWALGLGIPSGILFVGSLLALPESDYPGVTATGAVVFGAGFGLCTWWFIWSKSRPYLDYEVPDPKTGVKKASIGLDFYGNGLGVSGTF